MEPTNQGEVKRGVGAGGFAAHQPRLFCVTKTSKYLALALFIILPFIGGYVGYVSAPEKVVEVPVEREILIKSTEDRSIVNVDEYYRSEYRIKEDCPDYKCTFKLLNTNGEILVENLQELYYQYTDQRYWSLLSLRYISLGSKTLYFNSGKFGSDACCDLVSYNIETGVFKEFDYVMRYSGVIITRSGHMIVTDLDGKGITVFDLNNNEQVVDRIEISDGTVINSPCGMISSRYNITEKNSKVIYGVHFEEKGPDCSFPLIEYREFKI